MPSSSKTRFVNPFTGRAKALDLNGLFLFSPAIDLKLDGNPVRSLYIEMAKDSLYKSIERAARLNVPWSTRVTDEVIGLLPASLQKDMRAALDGDDVAGQRIGADGIWNMFYSVCATDRTNALQAHEQWTIDIERACVPAGLLCNENRFEEAAASLASDPLMQLFLWPAARDAISAAQDFPALIGVRAAIALEVRLSILACWDVGLHASQAGADGESFHFLFSLNENKHANPAGALFDYVSRTAGLQSSTALVEDRRLAGKDIDVMTLAAWRRGQNLPSWPYLAQLWRALFGEKTIDDAKRLLWAGKYASFIGYYAERMQTIAERGRGTIAEQSSLPWPMLPFGYRSVTAWCHHRYAFWLDFHARRACGAMAQAHQ